LTLWKVQFSSSRLLKTWQSPCNQFEASVAPCHVNVKWVEVIALVFQLDKNFI
jgi:hypothetical protein